MQDHDPDTVIFEEISPRAFMVKLMSFVMQ